ncbi:MAG TPA: hypothetical protein VI775_02530 [Candidatus Paceibacterota bacterium]
MDTNNQNSSGMMNGMPPVPQQEKKVGPIVGALIIVLIIIIAALYFIGQRLNINSIDDQNMTEEINQEQTMTVDQNIISEGSAGPDNIQTLEADLDNELKNIDYSF